MYKIQILLLILILFISCKQEEKGNIYWINSSRAKCEGVGVRDCYLIQKNEKDDAKPWQYFYSEIEGFEYEPGYFYKLLVREEPVEGNVPADASNIKYKLVKLISKMPDPVFRLNGNWKLEYCKGTELEGLQKTAQIQLDIYNLEITGNDGCNNFRGTISRLDNEAVSFEKLWGTRKMCPDIAISQQFNYHLQQVRNYRFRRQELFLTDEYERILLRFAKAEKLTGAATKMKTLTN